MKLIIDIPEELAKKQWYTDKEIWKVIRTVWNGTPIPDNATVCDIDAIRREIEDLYIITNPASDPYDGGYYTALIDVKRIIDKYTKGDTDV